MGTASGRRSSRVACKTRGERGTRQPECRDPQSRRRGASPQEPDSRWLCHSLLWGDPDTRGGFLPSAPGASLCRSRPGLVPEANETNRRFGHRETGGTGVGGSVPVRAGRNRAGRPGRRHIPLTVTAVGGCLSPVSAADKLVAGGREHRCPSLRGEEINGESEELSDKGRGSQDVAVMSMTDQNLPPTPRGEDKAD